MFGALFGGLGGGYFDQNYRAYPVAFIDKEAAERGDKVILPPSALNTLATMHVEYPMLFRIENKREGRHSHCGVLEFVAQEGICYMPMWMMQNLLLSEGELVNLRNVSLPKGTFIKIQPHTSDFLDISNPKAVLETSLRGFTCLTQGDTFCIDYNGRKYFIDVIEVKPDSAISIIETDVSVDFAPPKDYKEPDYKAAAQAVAVAAAAAAAAAAPDMAGGAAGAGPSKAAPAEPEEPQFLVFGGSGKRLDGKAAGPANPIAVPLSKLQRGGAAAPSSRPEEAAQPGPSSAGAQGGLKAGKVMFGGDAGGVPGNRLAARLAAKKAGAGGGPVPAAPRAKEPAEEKKEDAAPSFTAFGGKGRSLKD